MGIAYTAANIFQAIPQGKPSFSLLGLFPDEPSSVQSEPDDLILSVRERRRVAASDIERAILLLCKDRFLTAKEIAEELHRTSETIRVHYLNRMVRAGQLSLKYPDRPSHPEQGYQAVPVIEIPG